MEALILVAILLLGTLIESAFGIAFRLVHAPRATEIDQALEDRYLKLGAEVGEVHG